MMKTAAFSPQAAASTGVGPEPCSPSPPSSVLGPAAGQTRPPPKPHPSSPPPPKPHPSSLPPPKQHPSSPPPLKSPPSSSPPPKSHPSSPPPPRPQTSHLSPPSRPRPPPPMAKSSSPILPPALTPSLPPPLTPSFPPSSSSPLLPPLLTPSSPPSSSSPLLPPPLNPSSPPSSSSPLLPPPLNPSSPSSSSSPPLSPPINPFSPSLLPALAASSPPPPPIIPPSSTPLPSPPSISLVERLIRTCPVWLQLAMNQERSCSILGIERPGMFLVRRGVDRKGMVLSVRLADLPGESQIKDIMITEDRSYMHLEGSALYFENIFKLVSFYCVSRDILPFVLRLPKAIVQATKYDDMEVVSTLGSDFWGSLLNRQWEKREGDGEVEEVAQGQDEDRPGGLFINAVSLEEHCSNLQTTITNPVSRTQSLNTPGQAIPIYKRPPPRPPNVPEPMLMLSQGGKPPSSLPSPWSPPSTAGQKEEGMGRSSNEGEKVDSVKPSVKETEVRPPLPQPLHPHRAPPVALPRRPSDRRPPDRQTDRQALDIELAPCLSPEPAASLICIEKNHSVEMEPEGGVGTETPREAGDEKEVEKGTEAERDTEREEVTATKVDTVTGKDGGREQETEGESEMKRENATEAEIAEETKKTTDSETVTLQAVCDVPDAVSHLNLRKPPPHPVAPPRRKRPSMAIPNIPELCNPSGGRPLSMNSPQRPPPSTPPWSAHQPASVTGGNARALDVSLYSPEGRAGPPPDQDSYSTSSAEDEGGANPNIGGVNNSAGGGDNIPKASVKRSSTIILDRAMHRLSMVSLSHVFTGLLSADSKLQKRIVELSRDGSSYLGHLVRDYRAFTLETLGKHNSSTEVLQEIRQMLTQLKSYLIQSTELQGLLETSVYTHERLESIVEAALCKSVLKPLREAVYSGLKELHTRSGSLKRLKENQALVLSTTSTDLGVTTSVPETPAMEKICSRLWNLHREYSPQRKIDQLLKTCKIIYESMSVGSSGRAYGADDFLPVLMYVLARTNMAALMLDVEYMMELMDPALQLGEGSYYLTTTYGALEHIKNFDKQPATRQLSLEVQDSIHRWERRRTLNKASMAHTAVQDFITVSLLEAGSDTKTLGVQPSTTTQELCEQCAAKFEVPEPEAYSLSVLVEGEHQALDPQELPLSVKTRLHHAEPRKEYCFVYRHDNKGLENAGPQPPRPPLPTVSEDSLIEI